MILNRIKLAAAIVWASPATVLGLLVAAAALASGGGVRRRAARAGSLGRRRGLAAGSCTAGARRGRHDAGACRAGRRSSGANHSREHELVHVAQYERWGPFFIPAYFLCAAAQRLAGRHPYWDNPFEREAFRRAREGGLARAVGMPLIRVPAGDQNRQIRQRPAGMLLSARAACISHSLSPTGPLKHPLDKA